MLPRQNVIMHDSLSQTEHIITHQMQKQPRTGNSERGLVQSTIHVNVPDDCKLRLVSGTRWHLSDRYGGISMSNLSLLII